MKVREGFIPNAPTCPKCSMTLDGFTTTCEHQPAEGAYTVCAYCSQISRFEGPSGALKLIAVTLEEVDDATRPEMAKALRVVVLSRVLLRRDRAQGSA